MYIIVKLYCFWGCERCSIAEHLLRLLVVLLVISLRSFLWGTTAHPPARERFIFFQLFDGEKIKDKNYFKDDYNNTIENE